MITRGRTRIIALLYFSQIPAFRVIERRNDVDILEQVESCRNRNLVLHTVLPLCQRCLKQQIILCTDGVGNTSGVLQWNLFVPALISCRFFTLERINTIQWDIYVRKRHAQRRVTRVLCDIECSRDVQSDFRKVTWVAHTGSLGILRILLRVIQTAQTGTVVTTGSKVHTGRERTVRIGLSILPVTPLDTEVFRHRIVGHVFLTRFCHQIAGIERATEFITLVIVRCSR